MAVVRLAMPSMSWSASERSLGDCAMRRAHDVTCVHASITA